MKYKRAVKLTLLRLMRYSGTEWIRNRIWATSKRLPAAIVLFHRVTDDIPEDGITVSTARFRWVIRELRDHYYPMSLSDLLDHLERQTPWPERTVVVTFDDGYRDNYECAAPILAEYGVPATFFILADAIGTDYVLPWEEHLRGRVPWMEWDQARELLRQGFEIGSHTLLHRDLGKLRGEEARREIFDSKKKLEDSLGAEISNFAYPFGGRENLLPENRELIRRAGYRCCCSAFGGYADLQSDLFNLCRFSIDSSYVSPVDLHFELRNPAFWRWWKPGQVEIHATQ